MKHYERLFNTGFGCVALGFALLLLALCQPVRAADLDAILLNKEIGVPVTRLVATDGSIAMRVQWKGTAGDGATLTVNAAGDLLFTTDGSTADDTVSTDGTVDVSDSAEDTFGEVADAINASANWSAILVDVLPSHSANNTLTEAAESASGAVEAEEGVALLYNTADLDMISAEIGIAHTVDDVLAVSNDNVLNRRTTPAGSVTYPVYRAELFLATGNATFSTGAPDLEVYAVKDDTAGAVELLLWSQAGADTTVDSSIDMTDLPPIRAPRGWRLVVVYDDDTTPDITAATLQVHGLVYVE